MQGWVTHFTRLYPTSKTIIFWRGATQFLWRKHFQTFLTLSLPQKFWYYKSPFLALRIFLTFSWSCASSSFSKWTKRGKTKRKRLVGTNFSSSWTPVMIDVMRHRVIGCWICVAADVSFWEIKCVTKCVQHEKSALRENGSCSIWQTWTSDMTS